MLADTHRTFDRLLRGFARFRRMAEEIVSPNPEDDVVIRAAIVGFSFHAKTEEWGINHFTFVKQRMSEDYSPQSMTWYGETVQDHRIFAAMALGYLLGLYQARRITDDEFALAEAHLPGYLALNTAKISPERAEP